MTEILDRDHPIPAALASARTAIGDVGAVEPLFMTSNDLGASLRDLVALEAQVAELKARLLVAADGPEGVQSELAANAGLKDLTTWLHLETRTGTKAARAQIRAARGLAAHPDVAAGLRVGSVSSDQAHFIIRAVEALPDDLATDLVVKAEHLLISDAADFDPHHLQILGRRILEVVAPDIADAAEAAALEEQERRARQRTRLTLRNCGDGTYLINGRIPELTAALLASFLGSLLNPRRTPRWSGQATDESAGQPVPDEPVRDAPAWWALPGPTKLGYAFCELMERINPTELPLHGTTPVGLLITIPLDKLQTALASATFHGPDGEAPLSASATRRLACRAGLIPAVLGSKSEVLDLGRTARLFTAAQKRALLVNHRTCATRGCDTPAEHCEMHHVTPWAAGGNTDLKDAVFLCHHDHDRVHDPNWEHRRHSDGSITFARRL
jgi:hypothetical protein